jgi:hypothetical protein
MPTRAVGAAEGAFGTLKRGWRILRSRRRSLCFCTIASRDFLPWAIALVDALRGHHPAASFVLLYVPAAEEVRATPVIDGVTVVTPSDLVDAGGEAVLRRRFTLGELCFALKPRLLRHALGSAARALYLDCDIDVRAPLDSARVELEAASAVLTPHLDAPIPMDGMFPSDVTILRAGTFNLGFIGVADCAEARRLLDWWDARVQRWGFVAPEAAYQGDQKWMDFAPTLFPGVAILREPGCNVGYWNLHSRGLLVDEGALRVNGHPLVFFHFSGFDPDDPSKLSRYQNRLREEDIPEVMGLARAFASRVVAARDRVAALAWAAPQAATEAPAPQATMLGEVLPDEAYRAHITARLAPGALETAEEAVVEVTITNESSYRWAVARYPGPSGGFALTWHLREGDGRVLQFENPRLFLPRDVGPGESIEVTLGVRLPPRSGLYVAELDLVHEGVTWFADKGSATASVEIAVGRFAPAPGVK